MSALIAAGLDVIYISFHGDTEECYTEMMGRLSFAQTTSNIRRAVELSRGTRLQIQANVNVAPQNRERLDAIRKRLEDIGISRITYSLVHRRGGHLGNPSLCDTPAAPAELKSCAVLAHTLFVDWRGHVHICDHDLKDEHVLGDLTRERLKTILERRAEILKRPLTFRLCSECRDVNRGGFELFEGNVGGVLSDWIYGLYGTADAPAFAQANPAQRWMLEIYRKAGRLDRAVDRLLAVEATLQERLTAMEDNRNHLLAEVRQRDRYIAKLETQQTSAKPQRLRDWLRRLMADD